MLDENLPAFFYRKSPDGIDHHKGVFFSVRGSDPSPAYSLRHGDPAAANSRNCYAAGLFDCYNPEVLYGECLIKPEWSHPSLSQEDIRRNGGVPPPPQPILPSQFTIQLYNPDLQVTVTQKPGSWGGSASYEFSLPQLVFRTPSASTLDRTQDDPGASLVTPKLNFVWRKESKLAKDMTAYMTGKSTDEIVKKKHRDPDIIVGLFRSLRELTIYEPNLYRVELEDPKGLELILLLSAAVIKDLYFSSDLNQVFNVFDPCRVASLPTTTTVPSPPPAASADRRKSLPRLRTTPPVATTTQRPPLAGIGTASAPDPRTQWELDAETARLRAQVDAEERELKRQEAIRRREREKADEAETRRLRKMVEEEEREVRRRQEEVDRETERLRRQYSLKPPSPVNNQQRHSAPSLPIHSQQQAGPSRPAPVMSGGNPHAPPAAGPSKMKKKSFWGLRSNSDESNASNSKLSKKASAVW
ncbi:hypothetical protein AUEXF2481DRAFT_474137 [Aureobasidium subglaciale EXF-2481]|uniref:Uncharacterized protein n=1 Tax=Aureobasidium subglaciale (strain EXF-2481) TaxID=1043005 RepID=A0A074YPZ4_AURSE|nr:uncharacterized protein AUEXF2481DRAFT_474137 [Aureobasidium subglaciale EXF-2481]KAI5197560.1 hypothetical protein E4T38_07922 [Aureobasidium subglaciale]KAI5216417.1 hypothetical protein E4T40_07932 [Aureobasidium subglaciale]KAI5219648.1 hypothetical protein E4T41_07898 [Aureobasidium subglaciale]KAI5257629.1 hypothetical protein E4T46_07823 [Aureobasidium subglaciale]KEQ98214.1 hypothetical protein AUEXF2481DRAFT_474137 [Aureobasidium subglaciale EXF-2481]